MKKLYNKIIGFVGSIPADKALHFIAGMFVCAIVAIVIPVISQFAFAVAFATGLAKEVFDHFYTGHFGDKDILATALGGLAMQVFIWII